MNYTFNLDVRDLVSPKLAKIQHSIKNMNPFAQFNKEAKGASKETLHLGNSVRSVSTKVKELNREYRENIRTLKALNKEVITAGSSEKRVLKQEIDLLNAKNRNIRESINLNKRASRTPVLPKTSSGGSKGIGALGGIGMAIGAVAGAGALVGKMVSDANVASQADAQVQAGITSTNNAAGFSLNDFKGQASALQSKSLFGDEDILANVTAQLQTFTNIAGDSFKNAQQDVIDISAKTGRNLKDVSVMLGKAMNDPIKGVSALSKAGIQFTDDQKKQIKIYQETGQIEKAQAIIHGEVVKEFGGSAIAAAKAGLGPFQQMKMTLGDLGETIGGLLLPYINKAATFIKEFASTIDTFIQTEGFKQFKSQIASIIEGVKSFFSSIKTSIDNVKNVFASVWGVIQEVLGQIWENISQFFNHFKMLFANFFGHFAEVGGAFSNIMTYVKVVLKLIGNVVGFILKLAQVLGTILMPVFKTIIDIISWVYGKILSPIIKWITGVFVWLNKQMDKLLLKGKKKNEKDNTAPINTLELDKNAPIAEPNNGLNLFPNDGGMTPVDKSLDNNSVVLQTEKQVKNYTFNITSLVNELVISTTELRESEAELERRITNVLRKAVLDVQTF